MNASAPSAHPSGWMRSLLWLAFAVACFHLAYFSIHAPSAGLLIMGYALGLVQLAHQPTIRRAFYFGLAAGFLSDAPQLLFFWRIFGPAAVTLWLVIAFWVGLFAALVCGSIRRWGKAKAAWLIPFLWTGLEYFRSELYYLRFSWLNIGYAMPVPVNSTGVIHIGMYGIGFLVFGVAAAFPYRFFLKFRWLEWCGVSAGLVLILALLVPVDRGPARPVSVSIAGVQMEFPSPGVLTEALDKTLAKSPDAEILVLSEYTLEGPVPDSLRAWCRDHGRFVVVGGKDPAGTNNYYNTAFVIGTNGETVFQQVKCVPIQFFKDGLPAARQGVWDSPWGRIGLCTCYDLSYTRVTDQLLRLGAQLLIVPTMDVEDWGRHEHELHSRVAPVRAAEYGIPIFRLASSGISQAVAGGGEVLARTPFPGSLDVLSARLRLPARGSLPFDRYLAPVSTAITAIVLGLLLYAGWQDQRVGRKISR